MTKTTIFTNGNSQAVRIPKGMALPPHIESVDIVAVGNTRIIGPREDTWTNFFAAVDQLQGEIIPDREPQPAEQEREDIF